MVLGLLGGFRSGIKQGIHGRVCVCFPVRGGRERIPPQHPWGDTDVVPVGVFFGLISGFETLRPVLWTAVPLQTFRESH